MKRVLALVILLTPAAFAQTAEFGRASSGMLDMTAKQTMPFSGSLSFTSSRGLGGTFGGTVVKDRVWFFGSAERNKSFVATALPTAKSEFNVSALPKSFLSLHSTSVLSPNSFVTVDVSQTRH
jgi:hypothetical protein